jgi:hypothetical protein
MIMEGGFTSGSGCISGGDGGNSTANCASGRSDECGYGSDDWDGGRSSSSGSGALRVGGHHSDGWKLSKEQEQLLGKGWSEKLVK